MITNKSLQAGNDELIDTVQTKSNSYKHYRNEIVWTSLAMMLYVHISAIYGVYLSFVDCKWLTILWCVQLYVIGILGALMGSHRLWSHRSYKAKLPLRIILAIFQSTCYQNTIYDWVRDHRTHHKFSDTDADPHNPTRGLFFAHFGWIVIKKHRDVIEKGKSVNLNDLKADGVVMFQKRYYWIIMPFCCLILPALVPWYYFGESLTTAWHTVSVLRYVLVMNAILTINSVGHTYGIRPYDKHTMPTENAFVNFVTIGEGSHNYHHAFPWDYKSAESVSHWDVSTYVIDMCAKIGWAYDLKTVSKDMIEKRLAKTGQHNHSEAAWARSIEMKSGGF